MVIHPIQSWKPAWLRWPGYFVTLPLVMLMFFFTRGRLYFYRRLRTPVRFHTPVMIVGSVSVGGSGKTPLTEHIAAECRRRGFSTAVVSNGYRKRSDGEIIVSDGYRLLTDVYHAGDEAMMMARHFLDQSLPIPVLSGKNRLNAIRLIENRFPSDLIILDDGLQFLRMKAQVEIATMDFEHANHPSMFLPWGRLRDTLARIRNVHSLFITKIPGGQNVNGFTRQKLNLLLRPETVLDSFYIPYYLKEWFRNEKIDTTQLTGKRIVAFSGLGHNHSFFRMIETMTDQQQAKLIDSIEFTDHHWYTERDCRRITKPYLNDPDVIWITTEKDAVKLNPDWIQASIRERLWILVSKVDIRHFSTWMDLLMTRLFSIPDRTLISLTGVHDHEHKVG